jgi:superfamily I DNA/RNA helicase
MAQHSNLPTPVGRQRDVLYLPARGHIVVLGTAGSGKTTLAILRAAYLGDPNTENNGRTLLLTFNRALVSYLRYFQAPQFKNVTVEHYHLFARGYLSRRGRMGYNTVCQGKLRDQLISNGISKVTASRGEHAIFDRGAAFFSNEISWIQQHGIASLQKYIQVDRIGRDGAPLDKTSRQFVFEVFDEYLAQRKALKKDFDWDDMATGVCEEFDGDSSTRLYKHVVIDEGQDFSPQMIRSLAKAVPSDGSVTFFGDMAQQIYGRRMSWKSAGLSVPKVWEFKENYRNTKQIAALGLAISRMPYFKGTPDLVEPVAPKADGPLPALVKCASAVKEIDLVRTLAIDAAKTQTVAILARNWALVDSIASRLPRSSVRLDHDLSTWQAGPKVFYGTFYGAKGLEFDTVFLPFLTKSNIPDAEQVKALGEQEAHSLDGKLLYVGVTRAKTRLVMTFTGTITELLPLEKELYQTSEA